MKKRLTALLLCLIMLLGISAATAEVETIGTSMYTGWHINQANFPDAVFRAFLSSICKNDKEFLRDAVEIYNLKSIDVSKDSSSSNTWRKGNIASLEGLGHLNYVTVVRCGGNKLTELNLSDSPQLLKVFASENKITSVNVSKNTALQTLGVDGNKLTKIDVSKNTALTGLAVYKNQLTKLDVSKNTELTELICYQNKLTSLDLSKNTKLDSLHCEQNQISSMDVSKNTALQAFNCWGNNMTTLKLGNLKNLTWLDCSENKISTLDVSGCPTMVTLVKTETRKHNSDTGLDFFEDSSGNGLIVDPWVKVIAGSKVSKPTGSLPDKEKIDISKAKVGTISAQVYTGKALKPDVTVKYNGAKLTQGTDYTVSYKNNKKVGTATVTVTGKGVYAGTKKATFTINPKAVKLSSLTAGKKALTVKWKKDSTVTGYEIQYSLKSSFKSSKKVTVDSAKTVKTVIEGLKAKKTYYVRIRTYVKVGSKKYYSEWSKPLSKKTK